MTGSADGKSDVLERVCRALSAGDRSGAGTVLRTEYPFTANNNAGRRYTADQFMRVFRRDGFIDRYSGERLVFPGTLRLLSQLLPEEFPAHPNWKMSASHVAFWELFPTIDHVVPVARGGADDESNWVTTSMLRNAAKANSTLEELGWRMHEPGSLEEWDGLTAWFLEYSEREPSVLASGYLKRWRAAAMRAAGAP